MSDTLIIAAMGTIIVAVFGVVWGLMRGEITELKARAVAIDAQMVILHTSNARAEERDKAFADTMDRLGKSLDRFDTKVDELSRIVGVAYRKMSPPPRSYIGAPLKREEEDK